MTEEEARLALLQSELNALEGGIRGLDSIVFQVNGWCVTVSLAIGGVALASNHADLLIVGVVAVLGFFLINCQFKTFQRAMINRKNEIEDDLTKTGLMEWLKGKGDLKDKRPVVGTANPRLDGKRLSEVPFGEMLRAIGREARLTHTFGLYLFIFSGLAIEAVILYANNLSFG